MKLEQHIGKLFMHSAKAVAAGEPADRIFAVTGVDDGHLVAWKHNMTKDGIVFHIGLQKELEYGDSRIFCASAKNGAKPTAKFKLDSFYEPFDYLKMGKRL
jgi:hypothetical protein